MKRATIAALLVALIIAGASCIGRTDKTTGSKSISSPTKRDPNVCYCGKGDATTGEATATKPAAPLDVDALITAYATAVRKSEESDAANDNLRQKCRETLAAFTDAQSAVLKAADEYGRLGAGAAEAKDAAEQDRLFKDARVAWQRYKETKAKLEAADGQDAAVRKAQRASNSEAGTNSRTEEAAREAYLLPLLEDPKATLEKHLSFFTDGEKVWAAESQWISRQKGKGDGHGFVAARKRYETALETVRRTCREGAATEKEFRKLEESYQTSRIGWVDALTAVMENSASGQAEYATAGKARSAYVSATTARTAKQNALRMAQDDYVDALQRYATALRNVILASE